MRSVAVILAAVAVVVLGGCGILYPSRPIVPSLQSVLTNSSNFFCEEPLVWQVKEDSGRKEVVCGLLAYDVPFFSSKKEKRNPFPRISGVSTTDILCRSPAEWTFREGNTAAGTEAVCQIPASKVRRYYYGGYGGWPYYWGWWGYYY